MNEAGSLLRQRLSTMRWALPLALALVAVPYQLGLAHWLHGTSSVALRTIAESVFFALAVPLPVYLAVGRIGRWLDDAYLVEQQARANERRLASVVAAAGDAFVGLDRSACITSWSQGAELLFGYTAAEVSGQPIGVLFSDSQATQTELRWLFEMLRRDGALRGHETTCVNAEGQQIAVEIIATYLSDGIGEPRDISFILRDITGRKQREAEIRRLNVSLNEQVAERTRDLDEKVEQLAKANAELHKLDQMRSEFVSLVSHQVRAPLTNMWGATERMQADCSAVNSTCMRMFSVLRQQITRLDRLVQDVLSAARLEAGELDFHPEPLSLQPVVEQVVEQTRTRAGARPFHMSTKPGLPLAYADRDRVAEVLANLLDNADKYSPPGARVTIELRADQDEITLAVHDAGPGLPDEVMDRIFDKFYRADSSDSQVAYGYGLGLYVCRRLVEAQGGRIWAENHPQGGAVFSVALPVAA